MQVDINLLRNNPNNPRKITEERFNKLVSSMKEDPQLLEALPLICTKKGEFWQVECGNQRLRACKDLGYTKVPIFDATNWTPEQIRRGIVKTNISLGENDLDLLSAQYDVKELQDWGMEGLDDLYGEDLEKKGEINFTTEILEENNYVVFTFNNTMDFQSIEQIFNLESVHSLDSMEGYERKGTGRVIDGKKLLEKLNNDK